MGAAVFEQSALAMGCGDGSDFASQTIEYLPFDTALNYMECHPDVDMYYKYDVAIAGKFSWKIKNSYGVWVDGISTGNYPGVNSAASMTAIPGSSLFFCIAFGTGGAVDICTYDYIADTWSAITTLNPGFANYYVNFRCDSVGNYVLVFYIYNTDVASGATLAKIYTSTSPTSGWTLKATLTADATYTKLYAAEFQFISGRFAVLFQKVNTAGTLFAWVGYSCPTVNGTWAAITWRNASSNPVLQVQGVITINDTYAVLYDDQQIAYYVTSDFATYTLITGYFPYVNGGYYPMGNNLYKRNNATTDIELVKLTGTVGAQVLNTRRAGIPQGAGTKFYSPGKLIFSRVVSGITQRTPRY